MDSAIQQQTRSRSTSPSKASTNWRSSSTSPSASIPTKPSTPALKASASNNWRTSETLPESSDILDKMYRAFQHHTDIETAFKVIKTVNNNAKNEDSSIIRAIQACRDSIDSRNQLSNDDFLVEGKVAEFLASITTLQQHNITSYTYDNDKCQINWTHEGKSGFKKIRSSLWPWKERKSSLASFDSDSSSSDESTFSTTSTTSSNSSVSSYCAERDAKPPPPAPQAFIDMMHRPRVQTEPQSLLPVHTCDSEYLARQKIVAAARNETIQACFDAFAKDYRTTLSPPDSNGSKYYCPVHCSPKPSDLPFPRWFIDEI